MALPVLDGNQSATTLSSVVTGGEHIVAHSVVCFGSTAISNITNAVSGIVVSISNFPATQTIAGTVTANAFGYDDQSETYQQIPVGLTVDGIAPSQYAVKALIASENGSIKNSNPLPISGTVTANLSSSNLNSVTIGVRGTVTVGNSVTIGSLPAISGTVTANVQPQQADDNDPNWKFIPIGFGTADAGAGLDVWRGVSQIAPLPVSNYGSVTIGSLPAISGTVTANNPSGALTTRFGSVTTANTAQITSAVTNTSRKYLLAQNISAGTVTIGIGFSPTTTQGIQLTAGGGLTFDAFCPTGAVYWLGAVTGAAFTILEG